MEQEEYVSELKLMQEPKLEGRLWTMIMIAGGHFAAIVVRVQNPIEEEPSASLRKGKQRKPRQDYEILLQKTFHRYTSMFVHFVTNMHALNFPSSTAETGRLPVRQRQRQRSGQECRCHASKIWGASSP
jgi:hypothetical protein